MTQKQHGAPQTQALVQTTGGPLAVVKWGMTSEQIELLKRTIARGTTDDEFALFMMVAERRQLDPFDRQIHAIKRYDTQLERDVMAIQIGIDGYRLGATRTGEDDGQEGPFWCGEDGVWKDVWLAKEAPLAAKVTAYRKGRARGYIGIALWASYVQTKKDGTPNAMWRRHGPGQLAKCAEALAIRKAFPAELGGTHTDDELGEDAVDAEFTEIKPIAQATPVTQAAPATTPPPPKPAAPPEDKRPTLSEDEVVEIIESMGRCGTVAALKVIWQEKIKIAQPNETQLRRLEHAYTVQLAEIRKAEAAERALQP